MKRTLIIALALALVMGTTAIAETVETVPTEVEAAVDVSTEEAENQAQEKAEDASTITLEDAITALHDARIEARVESLKAELDGYVAGGKLTQEQADLILKQFSEEKKDQRHDRHGGQEKG